MARGRGVTGTMSPAAPQAAQANGNGMHAQGSGMAAPPPKPREIYVLDINEVNALLETIEPVHEGLKRRYRYPGKITVSAETVAKFEKNLKMAFTDMALRELNKRGNEDEKYEEKSGVELSGRYRQMNIVI